jgi:type I restriction enzyme R subunit
MAALGTKAGVDENILELALLDWLGALGYEVKRGPEIAHDGLTPERTSYRQVVLEGRLRNALAKLNPGLAESALEEALRRLTRTTSPDLILSNRDFHRMVVNGVEVETATEERGVRGELVKVIDFDDHEANDFLVVNQLTVEEGRNVRRPDVVVFVNGLPLVVIELKNPADEEADIWKAFNQLQTYNAGVGGSNPSPPTTGNRS